MPWMVLANGFLQEQIVGQLVVAAVVGVVTGVLSAKISIVVHGGKIRAISASLGTLVEGFNRLDKEVSATREERAKCELRASRQFVDHEEYVHQIAIQGTFERAVLDRLDLLRSGMDAKIERVHDRITHAVKELALIRGQQSVVGTQRDDPT